MKPWCPPIVFLVLSQCICQTLAEHHMRKKIQSRQDSGGASLQLVIANMCKEPIWPGVVTQGGNNPDATGFMLSPGSNQTIHVSSDWQGRVWGRTNCTFNDPNSPGGCTTGECGSLDCKQAGNPPATLAEFTMDGGQDQTFYDISLVDGYNLPMAIVLRSNGLPELESIEGSSTNPSCVGSVGNVALQSFNPYGNSQVFLDTTAADPLDFERQESPSDIAKWCPWDLQVNPPKAPGDGVYPYPDGNVQRPPFNPCLSACAKYNKPKYCCTGQYDGSGKCSPNYYSKIAKSTCPDAYSYAYDDQDSTFIVPKGGEFDIIFCPGGRSTTIIASSKKAGSSTSGASKSKRSLITPQRSWEYGSGWDGAYLAFWAVVLLTWVA